MKIQFYLLAILATFCTSVSSFNTREEYMTMEKEFAKYRATHSKYYYPQEYGYRFARFADTHNRIQEHNSNPDKSWQMEHNKYSDMYPFEHQHLRAYKQPNENNLSSQYWLTYEYDPNYETPTAVDWRANGWVTPVKDQGQCGSCWAFSSTGTMEGQHANVTGNLVSLSEQDLVDCVDDCYGCQGGWMNKAMEYVVEHGGIDTEESYPYVGVTDPQCKFNKTDVGAKFIKVVNITQGDCRALEQAVARFGPISVAVNAMGIMNYQTGIYSDKNCDPTALDHGVLVVGFGQTTDGRKFWIVKNSWNASWGQDGYIYWDRDIDDMCGICQAASYPIAQPSNTTS